MIILSGAANLYRRASLTVKLIGWVGIVSGAIVGVAQAWPFVEPYWYAHRGWVRTYDASELAPWQQRIIKIQVQQDADRRERLLDEVQKRETQLQDPSVKATPEYEALVKQRVERVKSELKELDDQDKSLFSQPLSK